MLTPVKQDGYPLDYWTVDGKECIVHIEARPAYCDRGRFIVKIEAYGEWGLSFDSQDGFPRYYFDWDRMLGEIEDFLRVRGQLVEAATA